jgi:hypothetical protein
MPVSLKVASHCPRSYSGVRVNDANQLLQQASKKDYNRSKRIIRASIPDEQFSNGHVSSAHHGFVNAVIQAYSRHHNLIIRPEDVWFSILVQLNFYINAHAEELRSLFVAHQGQKELEVIDVGTIASADFGGMAIRMTGLIEKNVLDPELRTWIMPDFTTTQKTDLIVAAILMMGALQKYFTYKMSLVCGIPTVTVLGEREDWVKMVGKLDKLSQLGEEPTLFAELLKPVLNRFVASFDDPISSSVVDFWSTCAHETGGSGPFFLSGWITAFCFWDEDGKALYPKDGPVGPPTLESFMGSRAGCKLDGVLYHRVNTDDIPSSLASVPVTLDDNGIIYKTRMVAGLVGMSVTSSGVPLDEGHHDSNRSTREGAEGHSMRNTPTEITPEAGLDTIQPLSGWWMYEIEGPEAAEAREAEVKHLKEELDEMEKSKKDNGQGAFSDSTALNRLLDLYQRLEKLEAF